MKRNHRQPEELQKFSSRPFNKKAFKFLENQATHILRHLPRKRKKGLYQKYVVHRTDGSDKKGGKHHGCKYFVLDLCCDPHAKAAIKAYADSCKNEYPKLAADLYAIWDAMTKVKCIKDSAKPITCCACLQEITDNPKVVRGYLFHQTCITETPPMFPKPFSSRFLTATTDYRLAVSTTVIKLERRFIPYRIVNKERIRDGDDVWMDYSSGSPECAKLQRKKK